MIKNEDIQYKYDILGPHSSEDVSDGLMSSNTMWTCR